MGAEKDLTEPFLKATVRYQARMTQMLKVVFKKIASETRTLIRFGDMILAYGEEIAGKVGKSVVQAIGSAYTVVKRLLQAIPKAIKAVLRMGNKIIALLRKAADPKKIIASLKKLFTRYVRMVLEVFGNVQDFFAQLNILEKALAVVSRFSAVLRMIVAWIADVSGAYNGVRKAKSLLKSLVRVMKKEAKELRQLQRDVARLKAPA